MIGTKKSEGASSGRSPPPSPTRSVRSELMFSKVWPIPPATVVEITMKSPMKMISRTSSHTARRRRARCARCSMISLSPFFTASLVRELPRLDAARCSLMSPEPRRDGDSLSMLSRGGTRPDAWALRIFSAADTESSSSASVSAKAGLTVQVVRPSTTPRWNRGGPKRANGSRPSRKAAPRGSGGRGRRGEDGCRAGRRRRGSAGGPRRAAGKARNHGRRAGASAGRGRIAHDRPELGGRLCRP